MIKLLVRADDLGMSNGVNKGILKTVQSGIIQSTGLMPNMPEALAGVKMMDGYHIAIGQHTNVCLGVPCAPIDKIPSLVQDNGTFKTSKQYRDAYKNGIDIIEFDEAVIEVEAQYLKFKELVGKDPVYFEAHAIASDNLSKALAYVAKKYNLAYNDMRPMEKYGNFAGIKVKQCKMESMNPNYTPFETLKRAVENAEQDMPNVFVCHPGFVDDYLLANSSLTYNREKEVEMLCDEEVKKYLIEKHVELISYSNLIMGE